MTLQKGSRILELGTREDGSGLLECVNLLIAAGLTDLQTISKIFMTKSQLAAQRTIGHGEISQFLHGVVVALDVLHEILVALSLLLSLLDNLLRLVLDRGVAILDEVLETLLASSSATMASFSMALASWMMVSIMP